MEPSAFKLQISKAIQEKCKNKIALKKSIENHQSPQEILELTDAQMQEMYFAANAFLAEKRYSDAANSFLFLAFLKDTVDYWIGFGASMQMNGDFETAITAYELAASCEIENPRPYYYLSKAFFAIYERQSAAESLQLAISYAGDIPAYQDLKAQALEAMHQLQSHEQQEE